MLYMFLKCQNNTELFSFPGYSRPDQLQHPIGDICK